MAHYIDYIQFIFGGNLNEAIKFTYYLIVVIALLILLALARDIIFWTCVIAFSLPCPAFLIYMTWQHKATIKTYIINKLRWIILASTSCFLYHLLYVQTEICWRVYLAMGYVVEFIEERLVG